MNHQQSCPTKVGFPAAHARRPQALITDWPALAAVDQLEHIGFLAFACCCGLKAQIGRHAPHLPKEQGPSLAPPIAHRRGILNVSPRRRL